jgi:hypothetical protein
MRFLKGAKLLIKALALCFKDQQIITRLYDDQLAGEVAFPEAESILWEVVSLPACVVLKDELPVLLA